MKGGIFLLNGFLKKNFKKRVTIFVILEILYFETVLLFIDVKKDPLLQHIIGLLFFSLLLQFNNYLNLKSTYNNFKKGYITGKLYINELAKYKTSFIKYGKWFLLLLFLFSITNLHVFAGGANGFFWGTVIIGLKYIYLKNKNRYSKNRLKKQSS